MPSEALCFIWKAYRKASSNISHQLGAFLALVAVAAEEKATVHVQESTFASSSPGHSSAYFVQFTCVRAACMEGHWISRHEIWSLCCYRDSHLLQAPLSQKSLWQPCCVERQLPRQAPQKGAGAEAMGKVQQIKSFSWHWPVAGGKMSRKSRDSAQHLCTVRATCDCTDRRQRRQGPAPTEETLLQRVHCCKVCSSPGGSWTAARWEICSLSRLWTAVWHWEGPSTAPVPLGISAGFIQARLSFLSAAGKHLQGGDLKEGEEVPYSFSHLCIFADVKNGGSTFIVKFDFIFHCVENGRTFCVVLILAGRKH